MTNEQVNALEKKLLEAEAALEEAGRMLCNEHDAGREMWGKITYELLPANADLLHKTYLLRPVTIHS